MYGYYYTHRGETTNHLNNPTYSSGPIASVRYSRNDTILPEYEEHVYDPVCTSEFETEKQQQPEANGKACHNYYNTPQILSKNDDADHISIKSDDVRYDNTEEQCTSSVKENKAYYSKNGKPKPQPKPRHSRKPATNSNAAVTTEIHYDVPSSNHHLPAVGEGEYTTLDVTQSNFINGGNDYQELAIHQPPQPSYAVPSNMPEYVNLSS